MVSYLLDTHVLLGWLADPSKLSAAASNAIGDGDNLVFVSVAAVWEMSIKKGLGRLEFPGNLDAVLRADHIEVLPIQLSHAMAVADLPVHHQDPFDRMQIAQARIEGLVFMTRDPEIANYDVMTLPA